MLIYRYILCIGIFFVCLSSELVVAESTKKYKKVDIDEDSREKLPKNKFEQKEKCKGKQCISGNPVITAKFRSEKFESSGDKIVNRNQQKPYKSKNINLENDEKYLNKVKKRLEINQDDSKEYLENQSKLKKRDKNNNNRDENKQRRSISKTDDNEADSEERGPRLYKINKKQKHYDNNNNDNSELTVQKKVKNVKFKNKNRDDDDEIDKFPKFKPKIKSRIDKKIEPNNDVTVENENSDDDSSDISEANSDVVEDKVESHDDDEDNDNENNSDKDGDGDSSAGEDDNDQDDDTDSQPSCNKKPDCKDCNCGDDSDEEPSNEVAVPKKKVKYSIKFAHEKQKYTPSESNTMLRKIHGLEKKKNM